MIKKHWVLLSAPPLAGKDTLANLLLQNYPNSIHLKLSQPLKDGVRAFFGLNDYQYGWCETPENKNKHIMWLNGLSWRRAQIELAEILVKPNWGLDTFTQIIANKAELIDTHIIFVSDLGFNSELDWFLNWNNFKSLTTINIQREGKTFKGDSRELVFLDSIEVSADSRLANITVVNNGLPEDMLKQVVRKLPFDNQVE